MRQIPYLRSKAIVTYIFNNVVYKNEVNRFCLKKLLLFWLSCNLFNNKIIRVFKKIEKIIKLYVYIAQLDFLKDIFAL